MIKSIVRKLEGDFVSRSILDNHFILSEGVLSANAPIKCAYDKISNNMADVYNSASSLVFKENHQLLERIVRSCSERVYFLDMLNSDGSIYLADNHLKFIDKMGDSFRLVDDIDLYVNGYVGDYRHNGVHIRLYSNNMLPDHCRYIPLSHSIKFSDVCGKFRRSFDVMRPEFNGDIKSSLPIISTRAEYFLDNKVEYFYE